MARKRTHKANAKKRNRCMGFTSIFEAMRPEDWNEKRRWRQAEKSAAIPADSVTCFRGLRNQCSSRAATARERRRPSCCDALAAQQSIMQSHCQSSSHASEYRRHPRAARGPGRGHAAGQARQKTYGWAPNQSALGNEHGQKIIRVVQQAIDRLVNHDR
jgi:hypothetical protein